jgi:hypothetical protein
MPIADTMRAYQQNVMSMVTGAQIELAKTAGSTVSEASDSAAAGAEDAVHQAAQVAERSSQPRQSDIEKFSEPVQNSDGAQNGPIPEATRH